MKTRLLLLSLAAATLVRGDEPRNTLFLSADLNITYHGGLYHVNAVDRGYFVINVDGRTVKVQPDERAGVGIKMKRQLRIAPFSARIDNWIAERAYSTGSDPSLVAAVEFGEQRDIGDAMVQSNWDQYILASGTMDFAAQSNRTYVPPGSPPVTPANVDPVAVQQMKASAALQLANGMIQARSPAYQSNSQAWKNATADYGPDPYDAIRITFAVSSPEPLQRPYVVLVGVFHERNKPKAKRVWVGARDLDAIDEHPQKFHLLQDGFPKGYELEKVVLHLYDFGGREIATNVSEQRMELTKDETFSYLLMDYFAHHKTDTLPATAALTAVPADWRSHLRSAEYTREYYVKVDKAGHPQGLYQDSACTEPVSDEYLKGVILKIRFRPALAKGKPVPGVARVLPANLVQ